MFPVLSLPRVWLAAGVLLVLAAARGAEAARTLDWDATEKTYLARPGETIATFEFTATNRTAEPVLVFEAMPSCGCTTAQLPAQPWPLPRGASGVIKVSVDLTGKHGDLEKTIEVNSSAGNDTLRLRVIIPESPETTERDRRAGNTLVARANRQAVFQGSCVSCHVPAKPGSTDNEIFQSTCAICHESPHRASMVPDLAERGAGKNADYWRQWIESGREGSLMPAFAVKNHGILTPSQVDGLVEYLTKGYGHEAKSR
jgi:mono/diheme cytochrome c family protein